jgi:pimeloyl-ACP methyl ester carboxylesterase
VTDVVFVIHGIRDEGYWTRKIAGRVERAASRDGAKRVIATETSGYGYFPMLSFLRPGARQEKVEWLMDRYTEARAVYPNSKVKFHFVGHSHGTYLLAKALEDYPAVRFEQVVFAGSVVHRDYQWQRFIPERVKSVVNFTATADWVVAFFPNALQQIGIQDLGSAGHDGFKFANPANGVIQPETYLIGGHSAALQESMWDSIAKFVVTGEFQPPPSTLTSREHAKWVEYPGAVAPLLWLAIAAILGLILCALVRLRIREWKKTVVVMAYLFILWIVLTRV